MGINEKRSNGSIIGTRHSLAPAEKKQLYDSFMDAVNKGKIKIIQECL